MIRRCLTIPSRLAMCSMLFGLLFFGATGVMAASVENPQEGAIGIEGKIPSNPPSAAATITTPTNGQSFGRIPITVSGLCPTGLLVKIFASNVFVGSAICENGSYSLQVDLFSGRNDLVARVFDSLDQAGPDSNIVTVTFNDEQFNLFGTALLSLTSNYAQRGANPGQRLTWPVILSGGTGPYALSIDWGDNKAPDLISQEFTGTTELSHIYDTAGIYKVTIKATDKNGLSAFLQVVGVANGAVVAGKVGEEQEKEGKVINHVLWGPAAASLPLMFVSFWLGRKYELAALRKHLERRT